jgi:hypothetical protein
MNSLKRGDDIILHTTNEGDAVFNQYRNLIVGSENHLKEMKNLQLKHKATKLQKNFYRINLQKGQQLGDKLFDNLPGYYTKSNEKDKHRMGDN